MRPDKNGTALLAIRFRIFDQERKKEGMTTDECIQVVVFFFRFNYIETQVYKQNKESFELVCGHPFLFPFLVENAKSDCE
jgi:hypothetical protein